MFKYINFKIDINAFAILFLKVIIKRNKEKLDKEVEEESIKNLQELFD